MATQRGNWENWLEFLFSTIGCLVGLGNVWRFPYVCYNNGGAAFLIPYLLAMAVCGVPMFLIEMSVCQFSNLGPGRVWVVCPLFRGIGYGMVVLTSVVAVYYNVIICWSLYYLAMSFSSPLPWATCDNWWNHDNCIPVDLSSSAPTNVTSAANDVISATARVTAAVAKAVAGDHGVLTTTTTMTSAVGNVSGVLVKQESSVAQFWKDNVLQESEGIEVLGSLRWQLVLCNLATWIVIFFCLFKDIKTSGKVVYVAAVLPYIVLTALLIRGSLLPGAVDGVIYYLIPQWHRLLDFQVWLAAASQVFYSAGIAWGGVSTLASFNRFHNNCYRDAILLPILDAVTSVFAGFVIFVYLGYMAHIQQTTVDKVVTQGVGLAFIAYPDALTSMPLPQLWAVLFFLVLFTVGLDSQFVHVQTITSAVADTFPRQLRTKKRWITLSVCLGGFVLGLPFVTQGGQYVLTLCDWYVASISVMLLAVAEVLVLSWVYGSGRLYEDLAMMIGHRPTPVWHAFWRVISPAFILVLWLVGMVGWKAPEAFPDWAHGVGWVIALLPLLPIPVMAVWQLLSSSGSFAQRLRQSVVPSPAWRPALPRDEESEDDPDTKMPLR